MDTEIISTAQFNYQDLDTETRIIVQQRTSEIRTIARRAATDIIEIGTKLIEVKGRLGHGKFGDWLKSEFGWSQDTATNFIRVTAKFGQIPNNSEFAPTALYMLSAPSVPDEARAEAIRHAEAGERITVAKAQAIVQEYKPTPAADPALATAEQLAAAVRSWIAACAPGNRSAQRGILTQINLGNAVGMDHLNTLAEYARRAGLRTLTGDLKRAVMVVQAELAEGTVPTENTTPIWQLEQEIRKFLSSYQGSTPESQLNMLKAMIARNEINGVIYFQELTHRDGVLTKPYRDNSLKQAMNNVRNQMEHADAKAKQEAITVAPADPGVPPQTLAWTPTPEPAPDAIAPDLRPAVWAWLHIDLEHADRTGLEEAKRLTGSLLDLEGFSARRGRNFDWESLVGAVGADVDHAVLREAVHDVRSQIMARLEELPEEACGDGATGGHGDTGIEGHGDATEEIDLSEVVNAWLEQKIEDNELPDDKDAKRTVLKGILSSRSNGYAIHWKALRQCPQWPAGTTDQEKLDAVRRALAMLTGQPALERSHEQRPPSWANITHDGTAPVTPAYARPREISDPTVKLLARKNQLNRLVVIADKTLIYLKNLAAKLTDPDDELAEIIAELTAARAAAMNED